MNRFIDDQSGAPTKTRCCLFGFVALVFLFLLGQ